MKQLMLKPTIYKYDTCKKFADEFHIEKGDLVITNEYIYEPFFGKMDLECDVIFQEKYGAGEPSDDMAEAIYKDIKGEHKRIIAIGGGTADCRSVSKHSTAAASSSVSVMPAFCKRFVRTSSGLGY